MRGRLKRIRHWFAAAALLSLVLPARGWAGEWVIETVALPVEDAGICLGLDAMGTPHISYCHSQGPSHHDLAHAWRDETGWHAEAIVDGGWWNCLAVDEASYPHMSYTDDAGALAHAYQDSSGWHSEVAYGQYVTYNCLCLDQLGYPHLSFHFTDWRWDFLVYSHKDGQGWHSEIVATSAGRSSLVTDSGGRPHIVYTGNYAHKDETGWHYEAIPGTSPSLALDPSDHPHVGYFNSYDDVLEYAHKDSSGWHYETVDTLDSSCEPRSLALDERGGAHVSYYDPVNHDLKYAYRDGVGWHVETVDSGGDVGRHSSVAVDGMGRPHISYYDATWGDVKYARGAPHWMLLAGELEGGQLRLAWTSWPDCAAYWLYGATNLAYFDPGSAPGYQHRLAVLSPLFQTWSSAAGVGDPDHDWTYLVMAVDATEQEMCRSNRVGEQDFETGTP